MTSPLPPLDDCPVAVKPLEWLASNSFGDARAEAGFGALYRASVDGSWYLSGGVVHHSASIIEAKVAAQADYEQRIRSALVPPQMTMCAVCLKQKPTPLRIDHMGGYVCLTCIDAALVAAAAVAAGSDEVPAAWLGYHPETNHTGTTELRSVAEMWEQDGIEVTPLYVSTITADKAEIARLRGEFQKMTAAWRASCIAAEASESRCAALTEALKTVPLWIRLMINSGSWDARTLERVDQELSGIARSALDAVTLREIDSLLSTDAALEAQERTA